MRNRLLVLGSFVVAASLWLTKLYTVDYCHVDGTTGIFLRTTPALDNRERPGERPHAVDHLYLVRADEWGYVGQDVYLWLMDYGYACSTVLSLALLPLALRRQRGSGTELPIRES